MIDNNSFENLRKKKKKLTTRTLILSLSIRNIGKQCLEIVNVRM